MHCHRNSLHRREPAAADRWLLTALFAVGVMNLLWVAGLALLVLAEKLLPRGEWVARVSGAAMAGYGVWMMVAG
ncbi:MAG: DUF2182 domain-containing protein [Thalassobaculum sp.]|uniref:copper chaperone n=1 Tax=Thalassobaculum sp. TaxID=2022740 RepID=UPI0032F00D6F